MTNPLSDKTENEVDKGDEEAQVKDWERRTLLNKRTEELRGRVDLGRGIGRSPLMKRVGNKEESPTKKTKTKWKNTLS